MLFLLFQIEDDRYALESRQIVEVLPLLDVKAIPQAPEGVSGILNYHGTPVPLIDLRLLAMKSPSRRRVTTRIVLVNHIDSTGEPHLLGILAEGVTDTLRRAESDFVDSGVTAEQAPYLGRVTTDSRGIIQWVQINHLLPPGVLVNLFCQLRSQANGDN